MLYHMVNIFLFLSLVFEFSNGFKTSIHRHPRPLALSSSKSSIESTDAPSSSSTTSSSSTSSSSWIQKSFDSSAPGDFANEKDNPLSQRVVGPGNVLVYDTTLRDGTQGESVSASVNDKLNICRRLAAFDVDYIEAGWPGSNPKDCTFFQRAKTELTLAERAKLVAFGSTRRKGKNVDEDSQVSALLDSDAPGICIVAKAHAWQVTEILKASLDENLSMIRDTVEYLVQHGRTVLVDMEHFFDGYNSNPEYALQCCEVAAKAGASCLVLCDTNGGTMPWQLGEISQTVVERFNQVTIGIHCHNDCGMAVANSVMAAKHGVGLIQGTVNGIGERTGNADLCSIVPSLSLHVNSQMTCNTKLSELTKLSRFVDEILNRTPLHAAPFVGNSAFAHKGGLHVAAMKRSPLSYQHIEPELVGNEKRILISELSGRQNILGKMTEAGLHDGGEKNSELSERAVAILERVKMLESVGYTFEGAEASVHLMILHSTRGYCQPFQVLDYAAHVYDSNLDSSSRVLRYRDDKSLGHHKATARATVKVRTHKSDEESLEDSEDANLADAFVDRLEVSDGNGPVDALAKALMRALQPSFPYISSVELVDYKVRIVDPESATGATTRVMIEFRDRENDSSWTTVSVDSNVISASLNALVDGFEFALMEYASSCTLCDDFYTAD